MLQPDEITYCFNLSHEVPRVEFKGPGNRWENPLFGKVVRAAMAMSNRRGGGIVIIGVAETAAGLSFDGLTADQLATWKYEEIAKGFNPFTNVPIEFERREYEHNGKTFLILDIHEFATVPVMCMKEYVDKSNPKTPDARCKIILRPGAFYIRTLNNAESKEMLTSEEIRTLFELVRDKGIQEFVTRTRLAGIDIAPIPEDKELFARQLEGWKGPILEEIRSRGYWDVRIRPVTFKQERVPLPEMRQLLIRASLNYGGWEIPYITPQMPTTGLDWIGLENQTQHNLQAWRFFQSGQFAGEFGFQDDWHEKLTYPISGEWPPGKRLSIPSVVFRLTEIFGLASRLAITEVYRDERSIVVDVTLRKLHGRRLYDPKMRSLLFAIQGDTTAAENIPLPSEAMAKEEIIARPKELAREAARFVFDRFGWSASDQLLEDIQSELTIHR